MASATTARFGVLLAGATGVGGVVGEKIFHLDAAQEAGTKKGGAPVADLMPALDAQGYGSLVAAKGAAAAGVAGPEILDHGPRWHGPVLVLAGVVAVFARGGSGSRWTKGKKVINGMIRRVRRHGVQ